MYNNDKGGIMFLVYGGARLLCRDCADRRDVDGNNLRCSHCFTLISPDPGRVYKLRTSVKLRQNSINAQDYTRMNVHGLYCNDDCVRIIFDNKDRLNRLALEKLSL